MTVIYSNSFEIPFIRLFMRRVLSANSSLKLCIQSTRVNFSRNPSESTLKATLFARLCHPIEFFIILILSQT